MSIEKARQTLEKVFGYKSFRPLQEEAMEALFEGVDVVLLMPTGGGKSLCYQLPGIVQEGTAIVVSPLISLMKDQVEALRANGVRAAFLNSSLAPAEQRQVEDDLFHNQLDLLYVSPEKLVSQGFLPLLKRSPVNLFAVDEAHCISNWGHDFRPEYTRLQFLKGQFPEVPVIALTATADKITRRDIIQQLGLPDPRVFIASFDRPNLSLEVRPAQGRLRQILDFLAERPKQAGIIYCLSRKSTENLAAKLLAQGVRAAAYHAGLAPGTRSQVQEDFINDRVPVICATVAFGMGIDKSNVRWVIHYNLPKNIESYYQEIGRSGRDGAPADTLLFYSYGDVMLLHDILSQNESEVLEVKLEKLKRMQQYAEAAICRRKMLLNYFGEDYPERGCGNCDVCKDPPEYVDGTVAAQKALSAVYRLKQQVGLNMLIDVLRGSGRREILERGYNQIKTFGLGRDLSAGAWRQYLVQMVNLGLLEVAYDQGNVLKLTPGSQRVLFEGEKVQLVRFQSAQERKEARKKAVRPKPQRERTRDRLFDILREKRLELARKESVPPYVVFNDATLQEMAREKPIADRQLAEISGVGERKLQRYGDVFLEAIRAFILTESREQGKNLKGVTYLYSLELYRQGLGLEAIARERELVPSTIATHLLWWHEQGELIDLDKLVSPADIEQVKALFPKEGTPEKLGPIAEQLPDDFPFYKIKVVARMLERGDLQSR